MKIRKQEFEISEARLQAIIHPSSFRLILDARLAGLL